MWQLIDFYLAAMKQSILVQFQYRAANYAYMIGMIAEPVIYLVVWSTVATVQGGSVSGYNTGSFAAYYIVWTLVRNMNIVFTPYGWEQRIRSGELSGLLLRSLHPLHYDIAFFAGWKVVVIVFWLPIAAMLIWLFRPTLNPTWLEIAVFALAIWGAFLIRMMFLWLLGLISFWTTRVAALYELFFALELFLSGRIAPLVLFPEWTQRLADWLPFRWTFGFPIEAFIGQLTTAELVGGLAMQIGWIVIGWGLVSVVWRVALRRYTAVGG